MADHDTKIVWVNPDKIETFSDNQMHNMFLHELGHTLGFLLHTSCTGSVMYSANQGSITSLTCGDLEKIGALYFCEGCGSPIIINLSCQDVRLSAPEVPFDIDGDGSVETLSWTRQQSRDGFLVLQRDDDGLVGSGKELFGNATPLSWDLNGNAAAHGFDALAWFDHPDNYGNGDGWIDRDDYIYSRLQIWLDTNHDGVSEPEELKFLDAHGVVRISTYGEYRRRHDGWGSQFAFKGRAIIDDGQKLKACPIWDVFLAMAPSN